MATEKEVGLRVEDFMGVNTQVSSEDMEDYFFKSTQNLYERKLGELQRRGGSSLISNTALPSLIQAVGKSFLLNDKLLGKTKAQIVKCDYSQSATEASGLVSGITVSFGANGTGHWGEAATAVANAFIGTSGILVVATGFGQSLVKTYTTSLPVLGDTKKLSIAIPVALGNSNFTGIDIYAEVIFAYSGATAQRCNVFVGHIDLVSTPTGTFDFTNGPITLGADPGAGAAGLPVGTTAATFTAATNLGDITGSLTPNKTYYVSVLSQVIAYPAAGTQLCHFRNTGYIAVTLGPTDTSILVSKTGGGSAASIVCIGLHPQSMQPIGIVSQGATFSYTISSLPKNQAGVVGLYHQDATNDFYSFRQAQVSGLDMLMRLNGSTWEAIPINNFRTRFNDPTIKPVSTDNFWTDTYNVDGLTYGGEYEGAQYFSLTQEMLYLTAKNGFSNVSHGNQQTHGLLQFDGKTCGLIWVEFGTPAPPKASYITVFKEAIILGGGSFDAYNRAYFSRAFNPYNWGAPAAASTNQYVQVENGGEGISGLGIYTNTTSTSGPISQLLLTKANSCFILSDLPIYDTSYVTNGGSVNGAVMTQLSRKVGGYHSTIVATDVGTIMASAENVWLVRESGEPTPLGNNIRYLLKPEDPSKTVDPTYWNAVVHDDHYKLAYSAPNSSIPNQEVWLNIRKMKELKGQTCWMGPHIGREIRYSMVEDPFNTTALPSRVCVDTTNKRWYTADREDVTTDFGTDLAFILEFRDFTLGDPNFNKLITRTYYKAKIDQSISFTELTTTLNEGGEIAETKTLTMAPITGYTGGTYAAFINARAKIYQFFPTLRLRGETVRKKLTYTGPRFFAISAMTVFYKLERRRPGA